MEIKDLQHDYGMKVDFGAFGDVELKTDKRVDSVKLCVADYSPIVMSKEEFSVLTKMFVQFENQILNDNKMFNRYYLNDQEFSYTEWLEEYAKRYFE